MMNAQKELKGQNTWSGHIPKTMKEAYEKLSTIYDLENGNNAHYYESYQELSDEYGELSGDVSDSGMQEAFDKFGMDPEEVVFPVILFDVSGEYGGTYSDNINDILLKAKEHIANNTLTYRLPVGFQLNKKAISQINE